MKKTITILFLLIPLIGFSQNIEMPSIQFERKVEGVNKYVNLLKLKDSSALIVKIGYSSYWSKGIHAEFIAYLNDGSVKKFTSYSPSDPGLKPTIKKTPIKRRDYSYYWNFLNDCAKLNKFIIEKEKLNITQKVNPEGNVEVLSISDGSDYIVELYHYNEFIAYHSYMPETYIKANYPGVEERQKLVDLMHGFEDLTSKY